MWPGARLPGPRFRGRTHGGWEPSSVRADPVELLEEQAKTRVPELVPIRYGRMLVSPFTFFRGAAYVMAADLAGMPRTGLHAQLCGDAHLSNFGFYAAPDRRLVFDSNDFDETLPGPFEWDLKRLVASFAVAGRSRGFDAATRRGINLSVTRSYRESIAAFAGMGTFDLWYSRIDVEEYVREYASQVSKKALQRFDRNLAKARTKDSLSAFGKLTRIVEGEPRFVSDPPLIVPIRELPDGGVLFEGLHAVIRSYRQTLQGDRRHLLERFRLVDVARKVVGVGSVGMRAWIALFVGRDNDDPLILQIKEAQASVLEPFLGKSKFRNHGHRVVEGQRLMQAASDQMLGWLRTAGIDGVERDFFVRQLWDAKGSVLVDLMTPRTMRLYARDLRADARPRARPLRRRGRDRELPRLERCLRPGACVVRRGLCRPERTRLRHTEDGRRRRPDRHRDRALTRPTSREPQPELPAWPRPVRALHRAEPLRRRNLRDIDVVGTAEDRAGEVRRRGEDLRRLDQGYERPARVQRPLDLLVERPPPCGSPRDRRLHSELLDRRIATRRPTDVKRDQLARREDQVVRGVRVVGRPEPDPERDLSGPELRLEGGRRRPGKRHIGSGCPQVGLHPLRERRERNAVDRQIARILERHPLRSDARRYELGPGLREVVPAGVLVRQGAEDHRGDDPRSLDRARSSESDEALVVERVAHRLLKPPVRRDPEIRGSLFVNA